MKTSVFLVFSSLLVQVAWSNHVRYFTCLSCAGIDFTQEKDFQCLNDPASITTFIHCNSTWSCSHRKQINEKTGKINSVLRGCEPQLVTGDCIYSNPNNDCFKFCYSENCNNEINPWHHDNPWLHDNHNGCSYNVASGFLAVAVPLIIFFTP